MDNEKKRIDDAQVSTRLLDAIVAISREMDWGTDIKLLLELVLREASLLAEADRGAIHILEGSVLRLAATYPPSTAGARQEVELGYGVVGWVGMNSTPLRANDPGGPTSAEEALKRTNQIAVPLINEGCTAGVLSLESGSDHPFTETHERVLTALAAQASKAYAASRLIWRLRDERDLLDSILGGTPNGVIALDEERRVIMINKAARAQLAPDETPEDARGNLIERYLPQRAFGVKLSRVMGGFSDLESIEFTTIEGEPATSYGIKIFPLRRGEKIGATIILQDLTEQKKLDVEMMRMARIASIGQLAAGVAHEIRNPLTGIAITLDVLREQESLSESGTEMIHDISREIDRLESLIKGLLDFARPQPASIRPMRLARALEWSRTFIEQCRKKGVECEVQMDANPKVEGDPQRLKQLFLNLAINALDATEPGGKVTIRTILDASTRLKELVRVQIADTGRGMDKETLGRIFDPFFTTKSEGTGLGLAIAHSIVAQHGGAVQVHSAPGKGTTFTIDLPCHEA